MKCASCNSELKKITSNKGIYFSCPSCGGRMVTIPVLKREQISPDILQQIRKQEDLADRDLNKKCPQCNRSMKKVQVASGTNKLELEICHKCFCLWFDKNEHDRLTFEPEKDDGEPAMQIASHQAYAEFVNDTLAEQRKALSTYDDRDELDLEAILGLLGLPFEDNEDFDEHIPWATYGLTAFLILFFFFVKLEKSGWQNMFGFVPADLFMNNGINIFTSFFLHHNVIQLIINMYFLMIFGDNVELKLGIKKFLLLLFLSHCFGLFAEAVFAPDYHGYILGPSAGIAGIVAFYTITYPRAKIGIAGALTPLIKTWVPVLSFFVGLLATQIYLAIYRPIFADFYGFISHVGGAVTGLIFAFFWKFQQENKRDS